MKINKKKIVKEIFADCPMAKTYRFYVDEYGDFVFEEKGDIEKDFMIQDVYDTYRIVFMTDVCGTEYATDLVDKSICNIDPIWKGCTYNNEEEFRTIIREARRIFEEHGEEMFQKLSVPPERDDSTPEMEKELYENRERLTKEGIQLLGIKGTESLEEQIRMIVEKVKELRDKPFQEAISDLLRLSAVYGNIYCEAVDGEWKFDGRMTVVATKKESLLKVYPLKTAIIYEWEFPQNEVLTFYYRNALGHLARWNLL
ncbi:MAG: hypothetical protein NC302_04890 [Bacteroidales bacterium]|nr:hypothetical protein [Bacteroidales bacterium]MCM1416357.1 hypothetical protein [bacterium]MCM1422632.1 hypothetical protein [bacterium]